MRRWQRGTARQRGPEAISFVVNCDTQEEVDHFWEKLSAGGQEVQCGWLKDRFGVSWQVVPAGRRRRTMATLKNVDTTFQQAVESKKMPGIVAMAATDKGVLYEGAFGRRELGKDAAMTPDTVVWIASMTKAITAVATRARRPRAARPGAWRGPGSRTRTSGSTARSACAASSSRSSCRSTTQRRSSCSGSSRRRSIARSRTARPEEGVGTWRRRRDGT
jgi:hypothetical protein